MFELFTLLLYDKNIRICRDYIDLRVFCFDFNFDFE